ncbi:hypothetical protein [Aquiflexum gelatinilyticum]|uniref:DUF1735 domain-containing protein n=1 Tax=Aquiflexum gelatinilyticum TaxID=2961943 RepID=A0A9X2PAM4_9BACT|nr:hypothetical protein [Aquiflexum gelatinilyticum]MCR9015175.1 hypothetical protein [Aquiflexum gelatinilyticum]MCS4433889.1 hypothetical protein [Aquiflexum gelatinilyticum]
MKLIKYSLGMLVTMLVFITSCTDFVDPRIPYSTFDTGAYLRTVARTSDTFNFFDLGNSKFDITVEAVDAENGATVESVEVRVRRRRLIPGVGLEYIPVGTGTTVNDVLVKTLSASDFASTTESKFLRAGIVVTSAETLSALGLTQSQINGGDVFEFRLKMTDKSGRVFNDVNASADIKGGAFYASPFLYNVSVVCPTALAGTYEFTSSEMSSPFGSCPGTITGTVTFTAIAGTTSYGVSDATFGFWDCYGDTFGGNVRLNDACGSLSFSGSDKYGDTYTFNFISVSPAELVFTWVNTSAETGRVVLKSNAGKPWPPGLR